MKTLSISLLCTSLFLLVNTSFAQVAKINNLKKQTVKVWGECDMCKKKIETAAIGAGAQSARWNTSTKMLSIAYAPASTDLNKIESAIAAVGYDTKDIAASAEAYNALPGCCQYKRPEKATVAACCSDKACCKSGSCSKDGAACTDMKACKEKACCNGNDVMAACCKDKSCCKDGVCGKGDTACSDMKNCQAGGCCAGKTTGVSKAAACCTDKSCCKEATCTKDAAKCTDMAACKDSKCCKS